MTHLRAVADDERAAPTYWVTAPVAAEHAGIGYRQLDIWIRAGLIRAEQIPGNGVARNLTRDETQVLRGMALLVRHGLTPEAAAPVARQLHHHGQASLGLFRITTAHPSGATHR